MTGPLAIPASRFMADPPQAETTVNSDSDVALMQRIAHGDESAFAVLVERHQHAVVGTAAKMLGDAAEAEDIAQQVFLRLWRHAGRYRPTAKFTTYMFTITRNLVFNESRRRARRKQVSIEERELSGPAQADPHTSQRPDRELLHEELRQAVDKAIASLPEKQRLAVVLRRYEGTPYEEIADILGTSIPSVKSLLFRARETLRQRLGHFLGED
jgi:RNA polymerase sigma-70 factor (ECF subfamily)